jgi:hypothetical protein
MGDEFVWLLNTKLKGEVFSECAIARYPEDGPKDSDERPEDKQRLNLKWSNAGIVSWMCQDPEKNLRKGSFGIQGSQYDEEFREFGGPGKNLQLFVRMATLSCNLLTLSKTHGRAKLRRNFSLQSGMTMPLVGSGALGGVEMMRMQMASDSRRGSLRKRRL